MSKKVIIIGGEGNGGLIAATIEDNRHRFGDLEWEVAGFINDFEQEVREYPVLGKLSDIGRFIETTDFYFSWGIHLVSRNVLTEKLFRKAAIPDDRLATIVHKSAFIAETAVLEPGVFVMSSSYVGPGAHVGKASMILANCSIGHDIRIGPLCHCADGSIMTAYSRLGTCADLAVGSTLLAYKTVGDFAMLGAASLATHDVPDYEIHVGAPARFLKRIKED